MEILLEEYYKTELDTERYHDRKLSIDNGSYELTGVSMSGKTTLVKNYLSSLKKGSYLYIDAKDVRIEYKELNRVLQDFCLTHSIDTLVFDNYTPALKFPNVSQLIIISEYRYNIDFLKKLTLFPLDYEEFLAFEHKYDSSALNHFFKLGGFPFLHTLQTQNKNIHIQNVLRCSLDAIEFSILQLCAKFMAQKLSAYTVYERLKQIRKISKDKLYAAFEQLLVKGYIHQLEKYRHKKAIKKIYLCDIAIKSALSIEKNFARLFENMVFLELLKSNTQCYYADDVDFYLPQHNEIILCKPFVDERRLFKKLEALEAFLFTHSITKITVITMNKETSISHPLSSVVIIPFDIWELGD